MNGNDKSKDNDIDVSQDTPIDIQGAEQHHSLKDRDGEKGDPDHADDSNDGSSQVADVVKEVVADGEADTAVGSALKKAIDD